MAERHRRDPDFRSCHRSIVNEMNAMKDRVGHLIQDKHWLAVGESKKTIPRSIIRRHLPDCLNIGPGLVVGRLRRPTRVAGLSGQRGGPFGGEPSRLNVRTNEADSDDG